VTLRLDIDLTDEQKAAMAAIPATVWFTRVVYRNAASPLHPNLQLDQNNEMKQALLNDWVRKSVKGKRVLDLFCGNGAFSFIAALAGAKEVVGVDYAEERIKCARVVSGTIPLNCQIDFRCGDVYKIAENFDTPFDVVLCFGGLYHIADPAFVLREIRRLVKERLILQTSQVMPYPGNWAKFIVRRKDLTREGMTSIRGGYGTWHYTVKCLREILLHGGFRIIDERRPPWLKRRCFHWYLARCEPY